jgi:chromosome segregation ATPase
MLDAFKKRLGGSVAEAVVALAAHEALQQEFAAFKAETEKTLEAALSQKQEVEAALQAAQAEAETVKAQLAELQQFAAQAEAEKARLQQEAEGARLQARKEKIVAAVGTARADALMTATEQLDEAAFTAVVSALNVSAEVEKQSEMFTEKGVAAEADPAKVEASEKPLHFNKFMKK